MIFPLLSKAIQGALVPRSPLAGGQCPLSWARWRQPAGEKAGSARQIVYAWRKAASRGLKIGNFTEIRYILLKTGNFQKLRAEKLEF